MVCIVCIVLKDRKTFIQKMLHESAGAKPGRGRAKARLAVVETEGVRPAVAATARRAGAAENAP